MVSGIYGTDLRLVLNFQEKTQAWDLAYQSHVLATVSQIDNLRQALSMRLLVHLGEAEGIGHPRYGTRLANFIGEPLDKANLELLRRMVRKALLQDERVEDVLSVVVEPKADQPGAVQVMARVLATLGEEVKVEVKIDA